MSTSAFNFKHADGTAIGTILPLESNGPDAVSVPRQILDIDYSSTPVRLLVNGDLTERFPASDIVNQQVDAVDAVDGSFSILGDFTLSDQVRIGQPFAVFAGSFKLHYTISAVEYLIGFNQTVVYVAANQSIPADILTTHPQLKLSTIGQFTIMDGAYDGVYLVDETGAVADTDGNTYVPLHETTPLVQPYFDLIGAQPGLNGKLIVEGASNGNCVFGIGTNVTIQNNGYAPANGSYLISDVDTSGSYIITDVGATSITIAGDQRIFFVNNKKISVSGGQAHDVRLTIASAVLVSGNTVITTVEAVPVTVQPSGTVVCVPATTVITVSGSIPSGIALSGSVLPVAPLSFSFSAPPAITPTTPHNFLLTWRISGDHTAQFNVGCPLLIKNNGYYAYQEFPIDSVSFSSGMTHIVTKVYEPTSATPTPDATGNLIYPAPAVPFGYMSYPVYGAFTSLSLIGKGSPTYNTTTTWGQALQDNDIHLAESFATGFRTTCSQVVTGIDGKFFVGIELEGHADLVPGSILKYKGDTTAANGPAWEYSFVVASVLRQSTNLIVTVVGTVPADFSGDGVLFAAGRSLTAPMAGQVWYDKGFPQLNLYTTPSEYHGVVVQTVPALDYVDMGNHVITALGDPTVPSDAVNMRTADLTYIAKTGGYSATPGTRSGSMTGSLNFGVRPVGETWNALGINMNDANTTMYGTSSVEFDANSTGGVTVFGTGSVQVMQGSVVVGNGLTNYVTMQNHTGASPTVTFTTSTTGNDALNMGSNKIVNVATPTLATDAANKSYVDSLSNGIVWLQPVLDPNLFRDDLNAPPFISTTVVGVSTGAANYWKISGNWASSFTAGQVLTISDNTFPAANASYIVVSAANNGGNTDVTVTASTIPVGAANNGTATDTSVPTHKTYIVGTSPTGAWAGLSRRAVVYTVTNIDPVTQVQTWGWMDILGRSVQVGDRFGVFVEPDAEDPLNVLPAGGVAGSVGKIATITNTSPLTYSFYTPTEPYAFSVTGVSPTLNTNAGSTKSPHFGHSYTFRGTYGSGSYGANYKWIEFAGPSMFAAGGGLKYAGNVLNVGAGAGITVAADTVLLDHTYTSGYYLRLDGSNTMSANLHMGGYTINNVATPSLGTDGANKTYVDNQDALRVSKAGDSMSGTLTFTAGTVTGIAYPSANQDAASKVYTDNQDALRVAKNGDTMTGSLILTGAGVGITLPNAPTVSTDAVNKAYADTKLALTGGTLSGTLTLANNPVGNLDAATKQYVDNGFVKVASSSALNSAVNITFSGGGEVLGLPATPTTAGSATSKAYVDSMTSTLSSDAAVVHKAGSETITGAKTFTAASVFNNSVNIAANGATNNIVVTTSSITMTGTPVVSGGASAITITGGVNTGGTGGNVSLIGGNGSTIGGDIVLTGGQGSAGTGGNVTITTGTGTTTAGQLSLTAGSASIRLMPTGVIQVGGAVPSAKSQALCSDLTNPGTASPTWQLVGTRVAAAPANSASPGIVGNWFADDSYFYVYGATGWRRIAVSTF